MFRNIPSRYAKARLLPTLTLRPSGFLYNTRNADSYTLNPVAACLVAALQRGVEPDLLWRELLAQFAVSEPLAHRDTLQFLSALHQLGLVSLPKEDEDEQDDDQDDDQDDGQDDERDEPGNRAKSAQEGTRHAR